MPEGVDEHLANRFVNLVWATLPSKWVVKGWGPIKSRKEFRLLVQCGDEKSFVQTVRASEILDAVKGNHLDELADLTGMKIVARTT